MKKILGGLLLLIFCGVCYAASEWDVDEPLGSRNVSDLDYYLGINNDALNRELMNNRQSVKLKYNSASTIDITAGEIACKTSTSTDVKFRQITSDLTLTWSNIDTGSEEASTTYYVYANCDADAETFTGVISKNATSPTGVTSYKRLGSFYNNSTPDITLVTNDDTNIAIETGTVNNGGTIALPTGYSQDQCRWTVAIGDAEGNGQAYARVLCTVNTSRVVTCYTETTAGATLGGHGNYLIACYR